MKIILEVLQLYIQIYKEIQYKDKHIYQIVY